jgi:hypothetical protein
MLSEFKLKTDEELVKIIMDDTTGNLGMAAKEELEYRKYLASKKTNSIMVWLTAAMVLSSVVQIITTLLK